MDLLHHVDGIEQIRLAGAGRAAAHVHAGHSPLAAQDNRAASQGFEVLRMANFDSENVDDRIH